MSSCQSESPEDRLLKMRQVAHNEVRFATRDRVQEFITEVLTNRNFMIDLALDVDRSKAIVEGLEDVLKTLKGDTN